MTNMQRAAARLSLILAAVMAGFLNGSPLAAPVLLLTAYALSALVHYGQRAQYLYWKERARNAAALAR